MEQQTRSVAMALEDCGTQAGIQLPVKELPTILVVEYEVPICWLIESHWRPLPRVSALTTKRAGTTMSRPPRAGARDAGHF